MSNETLNEFPYKVCDRSVSTCQICGSNNTTRVVSLTKIEYMMCRECGLQKQVLDGEVARPRFIEAQEAYSSRDSVLFLPFVKVLSRISAKKRLKVIRRYLLKGSLIEVGPGTGEFLMEARNAGYDVEAVEASGHLAEYIRTEINERVHNVTLEEFALEEYTFDGIYSSHVIEHVIDPITHLGLSGLIVRKGGYLFVSTPNSDCWERVIAGRKWAAYLMGHLHLFSPRSLSLYLDKTGWEVMEVRTYASSSDWLRAIVSLSEIREKKASVEVGGERIRLLPSWLSRLIFICSGLILWPLTAVQASLKKGSDLFIVARKKVDK